MTQTVQSPLELYKQPPPQFGHELLKYYAFDPDYINLNNGSYGATPLPVLDALNKLTLQIEANPDLFHRLKFQGLLLDVRRRLAQHLGADVDEVVLVANASTGVNTILRNFQWEEGDTLISLNTTYESVNKTVKYLGDIYPQLNIKQFHLFFPTTHKEIIANFKDFIAANLPAKGKKCVVIIDSIISNPGVALPWKELVAIAKEAAMWTVIDAAHSIGQEPDINLSETQPDFFVSNCHKWMSARRSAAVLYVPRRNQHIIKSTFPTSSSYVSAESVGDTYFVDQFEWTATIDYTPFLSVAHAIDFRNWVGGERKINEYCHELALKGGKRIAEIMGTSVMDPDGELTFNMVNVGLPLPGDVTPGPEITRKFYDKLLEKYKAFGAVYYHNGRWWTRCSAQIWNELEDFEKYGEILVKVCNELVEELGLKKAEP
ncbi:hypothetical protein H0H92_004104 [Tricholoma furcatifolium]|nr:hypothetical protein H0H92_004104 [Tricholoma furcatifolium]